VYTVYFRLKFYSVVQLKGLQNSADFLLKSLTVEKKVNVNVKERIAVNGFTSHSYGTSLAI